MGRAEKSVTETKRLTDRVLRTIKDSYNRIAFQKVPPYVMESENLRDILDEFLPILAKKKPFDKEGTTNLVMYAAPRLPQEIFNLENDIVVKFNDDPNFFVEAGIKKEGVKSPPSRNRWYKVETVVDEKRQDANKTIITIHAQSQTAVIETLVHLSAVEILRERIRTILGPNKQIDQD